MNNLCKHIHDTRSLQGYLVRNCDQDGEKWHRSISSFPNVILFRFQEDGDNIIFKNEITSADTNGVISRQHDVEIAFSCAYPKVTNLTLGFTHKNPYAFTEKGFGAFTFQFEFFESERFRTQVTSSTYPVEVYLKQMMFMQIEATTSIPSTELFVESCRATPYDNPNSRISYTIIQNGCVCTVNSELLFISRLSEELPVFLL